MQKILQWFWCHFKAETLGFICEKFYKDSLNGNRAMSLSASQTEGGGGSGSGGSGSLCTNSMGKFNFLISIGKKVHIFFNSLPIALNLVPKWSI